jgi:hypothetical protein
MFLTLVFAILTLLFGQVASNYKKKNDEASQAIATLITILFTILTAWSLDSTLELWFNIGG